MDSRVKRILFIAAAVAIPGGLALGVWYVLKRRQPGKPWLAGLVLGTIGQTGTAIAADIATKNNVGLNVEALARMLASEGRAERDRIARGWVAINDARVKTGGDVYKVITLRTTWDGIVGGKRFSFSRSGYFGEQGAGGRYSTAKPSTPKTRTLAARLLRGEIADPTHGATRFLDGKAFKSQRGVRKGTTLESKSAEWAKEGFRPVRIAGTADDFFVFTRRKVA